LIDTCDFSRRITFDFCKNEYFGVTLTRGVTFFVNVRGLTKLENDIQNEKYGKKNPDISSTGCGSQVVL